MRALLGVVLAVVPFVLACAGADPQPAPPSAPEPASPRAKPRRSKSPRTKPPRTAPAPPSPSADREELVDDVVQWCARTEAPIEALCSAPGAHPPLSGSPLTIRLGLAFSTGDTSLESGSLGVLDFWGRDGVAAGSLFLPRAGTAEAVEAARLQVIECFRTDGCPGGIRVPASVWDQLQSGIATQGRLSVDRAGHPRGITPSGHGTPQIYDLGYTDRGPGYWVVGIGSARGLSSVAVLLDVPVRSE